MQLPPCGFSFTNLVGEYEIINEGYEDYIQQIKISEPKNYSYKSLNISDFNPRDIYLAVYNLQPDNKKKVIKFCNTYGLLSSRLLPPFFTQNVPNDLSDESSEFKNVNIQLDYMSLFDFFHQVGTIQAVLNTYNNLHNKTNGSTPHLLLENLLTLVSSRYSSIHPNYLHDSSAELHNFIFPNEHNTPDFIFTFFDELNKIRNNANKVSHHLYENLCIFITKLENSKLPDTINDYGFFTVSPEYHFSNDIKTHLYDIAPMLLTWRLNELLERIPVRLMIDKQENLHLNWSPSSLFEYTLLSLAFDLTPDRIFSICQNPGCAATFIPKNHSDAMYCSPECGLAAAKRRQRIRDKENPNRERQKSKFQSKKRTPDSSSKK